MKLDSLKVWAILTLVLFSTGAAMADIVYLKDGSRIEGTVTRSDGKISVQTSGGVKVFDKKQVLYVSKAKTKTEPRQTKKSSSLPTDLLFPPLAQQKSFGIERASRPEPIIFYLMQKIADAPSSQASANLKAQLKRWRSVAHENKRNAGRGKWTKPEEFLRRRQIYETRLDEANKLLEEAAQLEKKKKQKSSGKSITATEYRKQLHLQSQGKKLLSQAAGEWPDLQGRMFLKAVAAFNNEDFAKADSLSGQCAKLAPYVAVFSQLRGMALLGLKRYAKALEPLTRAMQLKPTDTTYSLLASAMEKTAGYRIESPAYLLAARATRDFKATGGGKRQIAFGAKKFKWLTTGRSVDAEVGKLPVLPYDRLDFNQAIAVPIGPSTLLVDESLVKDTTEIYVRIGPDTVARATAVKGRSRRSKKGGTPPPLALIEVKGCVFKPLEVAAADSLQANTPVKGYGLNYWFEMGAKARAFSAKLISGELENTFTLSANIAPGEASGPILNDEGQLVGFLAGKIDPLADMGGTDRLILSDELESLIKRGQKKPRKSTKSQLRKVAGKLFVVHAITTEILP